jgi:hypothetical protein
VLERPEPLSPPEAKKLVRTILDEGVFVVCPHAQDECRKDSITDPDLVNVLRGGVYDPAEWENGSWRYPVRTARLHVVMRFESETEIEVVTAWRYRR